MQLRHHRVLSEIQEAGLMATPNLYWEDRREQQQWVSWLKANTAVSVVSRDFTRTRSKKEFSEKLTGLLDLLSDVGRTFHVLIVGAGPAHAPFALCCLANLGFTCSIITSDPILKASHGKRYERDEKGKLRISSYLETSIPELAIHNMHTSEDALFDAISNTLVAERTPRNMLPRGNDFILHPGSRSTTLDNRAA